MIGTKSGIVMQERKQEMSCGKVQVEMQADIFEHDRILNIWGITFGADIA